MDQILADSSLINKQILVPRVVIDILWIRAIGEADPWLECSRTPPWATLAARPTGTLR